MSLYGNTDVSSLSLWQLWQGRWQGTEIVVKMLHVRDWTTRKSRDFNEEYPKLRWVQCAQITQIKGTVRPEMNSVIIYCSILFQIRVIIVTSNQNQ